MFTWLLIWHYIVEQIVTAKVWKTFPNEVQWRLTQKFPIMQYFVVLYAVAIIEDCFETAGNTGRKTWQTERPGEIYEIRETPKGTKKIGKSVWTTFNKKLAIKDRRKEKQANDPTESKRTLFVKFVSMLWEDI